eukprot:gene12771-8709_t
MSRLECLRSLDPLYRLATVVGQKLCDSREQGHHYYGLQLLGFVHVPPEPVMYRENGIPWATTVGEEYEKFLSLYQGQFHLLKDIKRASLQPPSHVASEVESADAPPRAGEEAAEKVLLPARVSDLPAPALALWFLTLAFAPFMAVTDYTSWEERLRLILDEDVLLQLVREDGSGLPDCIPPPLRPMVPLAAEEVEPVRPAVQLVGSDAGTASASASRTISSRTSRGSNASTVLEEVGHSSSTAIAREVEEVEEGKYDEDEEVVKSGSSTTKGEANNDSEEKEKELQKRYLELLCFWLPTLEDIKGMRSPAAEKLLADVEVEKANKRLRHQAYDEEEEEDAVEVVQAQKDTLYSVWRAIRWEMDITMNIVLENPKNYQVWNHRLQLLRGAVNATRDEMLDYARGRDPKTLQAELSRRQRRREWRRRAQACCASHRSQPSGGEPVQGPTSVSISDTAEEEVAAAAAVCFNTLRHWNAYLQGCHYPLLRLHLDFDERQKVIDVLRDSNPKNCHVWLHWHEITCLFPFLVSPPSLNTLQVHLQQTARAEAATPEEFALVLPASCPLHAEFELTHRFLVLDACNNSAWSHRFNTFRHRLVTPLVQEAAAHLLYDWVEDFDAAGVEQLVREGTGEPDLQQERHVDPTAPPTHHPNESSSQGRAAYLQRLRDTLRVLCQREMLYALHHLRADLSNECPYTHLRATAELFQTVDLKCAGVAAALDSMCPACTARACAIGAATPSATGPCTRHAEQKREGAPSELCCCCCCRVQRIVSVLLEDPRTATASPNALLSRSQMCTLMQGSGFGRLVIPPMEEGLQEEPPGGPVPSEHETTTSCNAPNAPSASHEEPSHACVRLLREAVQPGGAAFEDSAWSATVHSFDLLFTLVHTLMEEIGAEVEAERQKYFYWLEEAIQVEQTKQPGGEQVHRPVPAPQPVPPLCGTTTEPEILSPVRGEGRRKKRFILKKQLPHKLPPADQSGAPPFPRLIASKNPAVAKIQCHFGSQARIDHLFMQCEAGLYHSLYYFLEQMWTLHLSAEEKASIMAERPAKVYAMEGVESSMLVPTEEALDADAALGVEDGQGYAYFTFRNPLSLQSPAVAAAREGDAGAPSTLASLPPPQKVAFFLRHEALALRLAKQLVDLDAIRSKYWRSEIKQVLLRKLVVQYNFVIELSMGIWRRFYSTLLISFINDYTSFSLFLLLLFCFSCSDYVCVIAPLPPPPAINLAAYAIRSRTALTEREKEKEILRKRNRNETKKVNVIVVVVVVVFSLLPFGGRLTTDGRVQCSSDAYIIIIIITCTEYFFVVSGTLSLPFLMSHQPAVPPVCQSVEERVLYLEGSNRQLREMVHHLAAQVLEIQQKLDQHYPGSSCSTPQTQPSAVPSTATASIPQPCSDSCSDPTARFISVAMKYPLTPLGTAPISDDKRREVEAMADALQSFAAAGADVMATLPNGSYPALTRFMEDGHLPLVLRCLQHATAPIDFTRVDENGYTPLHYISVNTTEGEAEALLNAIVDRQQKQQQQRQPADRIDWTKVDLWDHTPLDVAAGNGQLSTWWRILKQRQVPPFVSNPSESNRSSSRDRIRVNRPIDKADWGKISPEDQNRFDPVMGFREW